MPKLEGSEKQVKWADEIRKERMQAVNISIKQLDKIIKSGHVDRYVGDTARTPEAQKIIWGNAITKIYYKDKMFDATKMNMKNTKIYKQLDEIKKERRENPKSKEIKEKYHKMFLEFQKEVAKESKNRLIKSANDDFKNTSAEYWIRHRPQ